MPLKRIIRILYCMLRRKSHLVTFSNEVRTAETCVNRMGGAISNNSSPNRQRASYRAAMLCLRNLIWDWKV